MSHDTGAEGSDSAVYPELARANLLRMRGDYKAAESQCLAILRRYPNNATANILLGDICAEKGDLDQSMQWYEMALDLMPESPVAKHKLDAVRQRFKEKETVATVEQLGLPTTKSRAGIYAAGLIAAIFVVAVVMYFLGKNVEQHKETINGGVVQGQNGRIDPGNIITDGGPRPGGNTRGEQDLLRSIQSAGTDGARVKEAIQDPRSHSLTVTYTVLTNEDPRSIGAMIARQSFDQVNEAPIVTLRGMREGSLIYVADAMRSLYEETLTNTWTADHSTNPNAWVDHILSHEWPDQAATTPSTPTNLTTGGAATTGGDATPPPGNDDAAATGGTADKPDTTIEKTDDKTDKTGDAGAPKSQDQGSDAVEPTSGNGGEDQSGSDGPPGGGELL